MPTPRAIAFDVIETLFPLDPLRRRLVDIGLMQSDLEPFFASLLRDAFALDTCGLYRPFKEIAGSTLGQMGVPADRHATLFEGFSELDAHDDVRPAFESVRDAGLPIVCLTNGDPDVTATLVARNGLSDLVSRVISIDEVRVWKPRAEVYHHAAAAVDVAPADLALVACHAWDCQGALSAGCQAGYVDRGKAYGAAMAPVQAMGDTLPQVVDALLSQ
ncbi:HAD-IA family hydrolase [Palleronia rufa]|uniref:HAD-IA family hydrolase n=1 Tax=Palleronia rufa TaxID=1530186 RepID=UPI0005694EB3|nr:HAD-IA family hydrolase [Palleronia rufa]